MIRPFSWRRWPPSVPAHALETRRAAQADRASRPSTRTAQVAPWWLPARRPNQFGDAETIHTSPWGDTTGWAGREHPLRRPRRFARPLTSSSRPPLTTALSGTTPSTCPAAGRVWAGTPTPSSRFVIRRRVSTLSAAETALQRQVLVQLTGRSSARTARLQGSRAIAPSDRQRRSHGPALPRPSPFRRSRRDARFDAETPALRRNTSSSSTRRGSARPAARPRVLCVFNTALPLRVAAGWRDHGPDGSDRRSPGHD